ncbi:hypothetical protein MIND_00247400 [Mycena indigotica]|uniref:Uncharacterized protein n=1 Tax=Mycena indigotica TaxID=2126181 RepID=A0A8H6T5U8_9AGAR|nr:uncharacterized protein MIND_00247400 [Mycena indigotica]KAF7312343.1 hypothetical protein MIND_00247400 [Mycena indigotica]
MAPATAYRQRKQKTTDTSANDSQQGREKRHQPTAGPSAASSSHPSTTPISSDTPADPPTITRPPAARRRPKQKDAKDIEEATAAAFRRWVRVLCGAITQSSGLGRATDEMAWFEKRHMPVENMQAHVDRLVVQSKQPIASAAHRATRVLEQVQEANLDTAGRPTKGTNALALGQIPHSWLAHAFTVIAAAGLRTSRRGDCVRGQDGGRGALWSRRDARGEGQGRTAAERGLCAGRIYRGPRRTTGSACGPWAGRRVVVGSGGGRRRRGPRWRPLLLGALQAHSNGDGQRNGDDHRRRGGGEKEGQGQSRGHAGT